MKYVGAFSDYFTYLSIPFISHLFDYSYKYWIEIFV